MEVAYVLFGIAIGGLVSTLIYLSTRETCEHDWEEEGHNMSLDKTFKIKHYQCTKCLDTKSVRVG